MAAGGCVLLSLAFLCAQQRDLKPETISIQKRRALVIGNAEYPQGALKNPVNDAAAVSGVLRQVGFKVTQESNLNYSQFEQAVDRFVASIADGDLALFYFAGHGLQIQQENYLVPVDFSAQTEAAAKYKAYPASRVREELEGSRAKLRILILDACRNNPFRTVRSTARGLAPMKSDATGTLILFATGDNSVADDNPAEANGLFTKHLVASFPTPGLGLDEIVKKVKDDVFLASNRRQMPYSYDGIVGRFYPMGPPAIAGPVAADSSLQIELAYWQSIQSERTPELFEAYLKRYPNGQFTDLARIRLARLRPPPQDSAEGVSRPPTLRRRQNAKDGLLYVWIPPGEFQMGCSPDDSDCSTFEKPAHTVRLTKGFWLGQTEVTLQAWKRFAEATGRTLPDAPAMRGTPLLAPPVDDRVPVVNINWDEAKEYCSWMGGRLPAEAEWEYAARAGTKGARYGPLDEIAWHLLNSGTAPVEPTRASREAWERQLLQNRNTMHAAGAKTRNGYGLHDMLDNVSEFVADWFGEKEYDRGAVADPAGPAGGQYRVTRGGSFVSITRSVRVSSRGRASPSVRGVSLGFRCAW